MIMRSKLFVPGNRPELFPKALASAADAVCFDLEDSVPPADKPRARELIRELLSRPIETSKKIVVRINGVESPFFDDDLHAAVQPAVHLLVVPKVGSAAEIAQVAQHLSAIEQQLGLKVPIAILPTIESARGLRLAAEIAARPRVVGLQLGLLDLFLPLGIAADDVEAGRQVRLTIRLAAGERGLPCYDCATPEFRNLDAFREQAGVARRLGFSGKSCIHPRQIVPANEIFSPTQEEVSRAREIVTLAKQAAAGHAGAFAIGGAMVDAPLVSRAEQIILLAEQVGMTDSHKSLS